MTLLRTSSKCYDHYLEQTTALKFHSLTLVKQFKGLLVRILCLSFHDHVCSIIYEKLIAFLNFSTSRENVTLKIYVCMNTDVERDLLLGKFRRKYKTYLQNIFASLRLYATFLLFCLCKTRQRKLKKIYRV